MGVQRATTKPRRSRRISIALLVSFAIAVGSAADRKWETGTLVDIMTKRAPWVTGTTTYPLPGDPRQIPIPPEMPKVAVYVIETAKRHIELEDVVPVGTAGALELEVTVGKPITFALDGKTGYIRLSKNQEQRLRVAKSVPRE